MNQLMTVLVYCDKVFEHSYITLFLAMPLRFTDIALLQHYYGLLPLEFTSHFLLVRNIDA